MDLLDNYIELRDAIYQYFGFFEDWKAFPIDDNRQYWWEADEYAGKITCYDSLEAYKEQDEAHMYEFEILTHLFYPKSIYEGKEYTMIIIDTHTDGNQFLSIFDNAKKIS